MMFDTIKRLIGKRGPNIENADPELAQRVQEVMSDVQAYARSHGGDIELVSITSDGVVELRLRGACASCPLSSVTVRQGVEEQLAVLAPQIRQVLIV